MSGFLYLHTYLGVKNIDFFRLRSLPLSADRFNGRPDEHRSDGNRIEVECFFGPVVQWIE
ncbi:MAG: hypothetical protein KDC06_03410 [Chitinophagaceae bacterium]|nr:hypothetical protein [Chitinophagaceae bacterium]